MQKTTLFANLRSLGLICVSAVVMFACTQVEADAVNRRTDQAQATPHASIAIAQIR